MATQYQCGSALRRQRVREHPVLNGIDFLEVLDLDAPPGVPRQQTLLVKFLKPVAGLAGENVAIDGGVRVTGVGVQWALAAAALTDPPVPAAEQAFYTALPDADHWLVVRTDATGDFSDYRLRLVVAPTKPDPPAGFDPQLAEVAFNFKVECPSDFDCELEAPAAGLEAGGPNIDYLAKDYASFRRLMLDRLSAQMPDWRERSPADVGITVVELLAYGADQLSYFQDAVATEAYLGTARRRVSARRHARLLDYAVGEGTNARAWVALEVEAGGGADGVTLRAGRAFATKQGEASTLDPADVERAANEGAQVFESLHDVTLRAAHGAMAFYTWSDERCVLPAGATRATLRDDAANPLDLRAGDVLILEETRSPSAPASAADADPSHRQAVRLVRAGGASDPLNGQPVVEIEWGPDDALRFELPISAESAPEMSVARGNVVLVDHGRRLTGQKLDPPEAPGDRPYRPQLAEPGITHSERYDHARAVGRPGDHPAVTATRQDAARALPVVDLHAGGETWSLRRDLFESDRFAPHFVVEMEEDGTAFLRFGDGRVMGKKPAKGTAFEAAYRVGNGAAGNVGRDVITRVATTLGGITRVRNPLPAEGGSDPERLERVRLDAPRAFRRQERAVTEADYAAAAERHEQVQKAVASRRWTGSWYTMFITIDHKGGLDVDAEFEAGLRAFLERFRLAGYDLEIDAPHFVALDIAMTVCVDAGYARSDVLQALLQTFSSGDLVGGGRGFFHPDNFTFGQPLYLSQVVAAAMAVPGVVWVDLDDTPPKPNRFRRFGEPSRGEFGHGRIAMGRLEIVRLRNDPSQPEGGKIEFFMTGGV